MPTHLDRAYAEQLDADDPLAGYRRCFLAPEPGLIYLDGNSLGRLPVAAVAASRDLVERQWGQRLIRSWNEGWFALPETIGDRIGRLVGAGAGEVLVADSTSTNLFKLVVAALQAQPGRHRILTDDLNFPSDVYILHGIAELLGRGHQLEVIPSSDGIHGPVGSLAAACDGDTALVVLSHTVFKSGYTYDMAEVTRAVHASGARMLWDLSHSAGAVPVDLRAAGADLAVGCTYKYLNGGPGAPAFLYVRRELQERLANPIGGWMGHSAPFAFDLAYRPAAGLRRFLTGTPPVASLSLVAPGVDMLLEAGMEALRAKSLRQTGYLIDLFDARLADAGYRLNSPRDPARRGSHISLGHDEALRIDQALIGEFGVLPDFRRPDNIRLGIAPLYTSFCDLYDAVMALHRIAAGRLYEAYPVEAPQVT